MKKTCGLCKTPGNGSLHEDYDAGGLLVCKDQLACHKRLAKRYPQHAKIFLRPMPS